MKLYHGWLSKFDLFVVFVAGGRSKRGLVVLLFFSACGKGPLRRARGLGCHVACTGRTWLSRS